jgi:hypothetical protein
MFLMGHLQVSLELLKTSKRTLDFGAWLGLQVLEPCSHSSGEGGRSPSCCSLNGLVFVCLFLASVRMMLYLVHFWTLSFISS